MKELDNTDLLGIFTVILVVIVSYMMAPAISPSENESTTIPRESTTTQKSMPPDNPNESSDASIRIDERKLLQDSFFGDFRNAKIQKTSGTINLEVWSPWIQHVKKDIPQNLQSTLLSGQQNLAVSFDEIWIAEYDNYLTETQKKEYEGQLDIKKLYWKEGKVQSSTLEKFYKSDPLTGVNLSKPAHKMTDIFDRVYILKELRKNQG